MAPRILLRVLLIGTLMLMLGLTVQPTLSVVHAATPPQGPINGDFQNGQSPLVIGSTPYHSPTLDTSNSNSPYINQDAGLSVVTDPGMNSGDCSLSPWNPSGGGPGAGNYSNPTWYSYTPSVSGSVTADTFGSNYDTAIGMYTLNNNPPTVVSDFNEVACNNNINGQETSLLHTGVTAGVTYYFMVVAASSANSQTPGVWGGILKFHVHTGNLAAYPVNQTAVEGQAMTGKPIATLVDTDLGSCSQYSATVTIEGSPQTVSCLSPSADLNMSCSTSSVDTVCTVYATHTYTEEQYDFLSVHFSDTDGDTYDLNAASLNAPVVTVADAQLTHVQNGTGADGLSAPQPAVEGTPVSTYLGTFTDTAGISPDGQTSYCDITGFSAKVNWGDGDNNPANYQETITSAGAAGDSIVPSTHHPGPCTFDVYGTHTYISTNNAAPLARAITLTVFDAGLGAPCFAPACTPSVNLSANALVSDAPAVGTATTAQFPAQEGQQFAAPILLGTVTDTDPACPSENLDITVNWGDGSTNDALTVPSLSAANGSITYTQPSVGASPCTYNVYGLHTYAEEGAKAYTISVSGDIQGGAKWSFTTSALVSDSALNYVPDPSAGGNLTNLANGTEGAPLAKVFLGTFHDSALNPTGTPNPNNPTTSCDIKDYSVTVDWGDASANPGHNTTTLTAANGGIVVSADGNPCDFDLLGSYTYKEAGTYTLTITTTDAGGATAIVGTDSIIINEAPLTSLGGANSNWVEGQIFPGGTVPLQHLGDFHDTDPFCLVSDYNSPVPVSVDWGDGNVDNYATALSLGGNCDFQVVGHHVYAESGTYTVNVTVTDGIAPGGGPSTVLLTSTATVADAPLSQTTAGSDKGVESVSNTFNLGTFTDADCPFVGPSSDPLDFTPANVVVNWGDGSTSAATSVTPGSNCSYTVTGTHTYAEEGNYTTSYTVTDTGAGGSTTQVAGAIAIADAPLDTGNGIPFTAVEGQPFTGQILGSFHDQDTACTASDYSATIAWGDGKTSVAVASANTITDTGGCVYNVIGGHTYKTEGKFTVTVTPTDHSATTSFTLVADVSGPAGDATLTSVQQGQSFVGSEGANNANVYLGQFHDNDPNCKATDYAATISWGDGSSSSASSFNGGIVDTHDGFCDFKMYGSHAYTEEGPFSISTSVQDNGGAPAITLGAGATVTDAALSSKALLIPFTAVEGANTGTIVLGSVTDADPNCSPNDLTVTINWGDGTATDTTTGQVAQVGTSCVFNVTGNHAYASETTTPNNIVVTVTDRGGSTTSYADQSTVVDAALSSTNQDSSTVATSCATAPTTPQAPGAPLCEGIAVGTPLSEPASGLLLGTVTDSDPNCLLTDYSVKISWGETPYTDSKTGYLVKQSGCTYNVYGYHTFTEEGNYTGTVTVTDHGGSTTTITDAFTVNDAQLTGTNNDFTAVQGKSVTHQLLGTFVDANTPGCIETNLDFSVVSINWNDQTGTDTNTGTIVPDPAGGCKFDVYGSHTTAAGFLLPFDFVGTYVVTVNIKDDGGSLLTLTPKVTIGDAGLVNGAAATVNAVENVAFSNQLIGNFSDSDPGCQLSDFSIGSVAWGDGNTDTNATITQDLNTCNFHVYGGHTYLEEGTYHPVITVNDAKGATLQITATVVTADAPLTAKTNPPAQSCTLLTACNNVIVGTFTDTNSNCNNEPTVAATYTAVINWGDGTPTSAGTAVQRGTSCIFDITGSHTFTSSGAKTITVLITDDGGASVQTAAGVPETAGTINVVVPASSIHTGAPGTPNYTKDYFRNPVQISYPANYFIDLLVNQYGGGLFTGHFTYLDKVAGISIPYCTLQTNPPSVPPCKFTILSYQGSLTAPRSSTIWATWQLKGNATVHYVRIDSTAPASGADTIKVTTGGGTGLAVPVTSSPPVTPTNAVKIG